MLEAVLASVVGWIIGAEHFGRIAMANCAKCGCDLGPGGGTPVRLTVGNVDGMPVPGDSVLCSRCLDSSNVWVLLGAVILVVLCVLGAAQYFLKYQIF